MKADSPAKAFIVVLLTALAASALVSASVVLLRPIQLENRMLDLSRNVVRVSGLVPADADLSEQELIDHYQTLDLRVVDLDTGLLDAEIDPYGFDPRKAAADRNMITDIPEGLDLAGLGQRARHALIYLVWDELILRRIVLPVYGVGMWSTIYGYVVLESDFNTIAATTFYEHAETPGIGDQITRSDWLAKWQGKKIYDEQGVLRFAVASGPLDQKSSAAIYQVDALTGATVTADAVTAMVHYWFGPNGYQPMLKNLQQDALQPPAAGSDR